MPVAHNKDFLVLYGSQTGQADAISEEIFDKACKQGFQPARFSLADVEKKFSIDKEKCVIFVCSTTGDGEPPDTALKFVRRIRKKTLPSNHLSKLSYAFLALGDSNYTNFCACGKLIDKRLQELGAQHFYETGHADDAVGLEKVVEPWIEGLYPAIRNHLNKTGTGTDSVIETDVINEIVKPDTINKEENSIKDASGNVANEKNDSEKVPPNISIIYSKELENSTLKIPSSSDPYLKIDWLAQEVAKFQDVELPNACTGLQTATIANARSLTSEFTTVKHALELELDIEGQGFNYQPGDSFGIVCQNKEEEVDYLIKRLDIENLCDKPMDLSILDNTKKKGAKVPPHIHCPSTLRYIFTNYVDFRAVPRKGFLRMLVDYTSNAKEKRRLQELCSSQGSKEYGELVREPLIGLVEILKIFESCQPPVERILEFLPRLLPREYSVASSPYFHPNRLKFVFNVIELPKFNEKERFGLCTRWLENLTKQLRKEDQPLEDHLANMALSKPSINVYLRTANHFRFPADPSKPLIMIGPGTGVAPYIGFLEQRQFLKEHSPDLVLGTSVLFYGCRYEEKDFLYRKELSAFTESGILNEIYTSFSRDQPNKPTHTRYVQENIRLQNEKLMSLIFNEHGAVYICGDAKHMGRDVTNLFIELIEKYKGIDRKEANKVMTELREKKQFLEDVWT